MKRWLGIDLGGDVKRWGSSGAEDPEIERSRWAGGSKAGYSAMPSCRRINRQRLSLISL